jgi:hypothetical protein
VDGVAQPNIVWAQPAECAAGFTYRTSVTETSTGNFGMAFKIQPVSAIDNAQHSIVFDITRCPGSAPSGCSGTRGDRGVDTCPSNNFLRFGLSAGTDKPSNLEAKVQLLHLMDSESCMEDYATEVRARIKNSNGVVVGTLLCVVHFKISDVNEAPSIISSSLITRSVSETTFPGQVIGDKLKATDPEVAVGLQSLTWSIASCIPTRYSRSGAGSDAPDLGSSCHIKISACDGELSVAAGVELNHEEYTQYTLVVQVTDDGNPVEFSAQSSSLRSVVVKVAAVNDPPAMSCPQTFYIQENVPKDTWVTMSNAQNSVCTNGGSSSSDRCEVVATDPDSGATGFKFIQTSSDEFFVVTQSATREADSSNTFSLFTEIQFVSSQVLDYESGDPQYDISVYAKDSDPSALARSTGDCTVTIIIIDVNDKPYLDLPSKCDGKLCVNIDENNHEGVSSSRSVNLLNFVEDDDAKAEWKCCHTTDPFTLAEATSNACDLNKFTATSTGFQGDAAEIDFESFTFCDIIVRIKDKASLQSADQLVRVVINDINDPPTNVRLSSSCAVDENTALDTQLAGAGCQLLADDEDDQGTSTFQIAIPSNFGGTKGLNWVDWVSVSNFFRVESNGKLFIDGKNPDYELVQVLQFNVIAIDNGDRSSSSTTISIEINDVNEPPVLDPAKMLPVDIVVSLKFSSFILFVCLPFLRRAYILFFFFFYPHL